MIRKLDKTEYEQAAALSLDVYIQCGAVLYSLSEKSTNVKV